MKDASYDRRVYWYNEVIEEARKASLNKLHWAGTVVNPDRKNAIKEVLTEAIVKLERTLNYQYEIDRDQETKKRIDEISEQMARSDNLNKFKREGKGETRRAAIKNTIGAFDDESPADFFDKIHQSVVKRQEEIGMPYMTSPPEILIQLPKERTGPITTKEKKLAEEEVLANLKELATKDKPKVIDVGYAGRVDWHNKIIDDVAQIKRQNSNLTHLEQYKNNTREISDLLIERIVELEQLVNPKYTIDKETEKKITEMTMQMVKSEDLNEFKRQGKSETRSDMMKFFNGVKNFFTGDSESPQEFLDNKFKDVAARLKEQNKQKAIELRKKQPVRHAAEKVREDKEAHEFNRRAAIQSAKINVERRKEIEKEHAEQKARDKEAKKRAKPTTEEVRQHLTDADSPNHGEKTPPSTPQVENPRGRSTSREGQSRGSRSSSPADWW
jgi:hypothetical protein